MMRHRVFRVLWVTSYFALVGPLVGSLVVTASMFVQHWINGTGASALPLAGDWPFFSFAIVALTMAMFGIAAGLVPGAFVGFIYAVAFHWTSSPSGIATRLALAGTLGLVIGHLFARTFPTTPGFTLAGLVAGTVCAVAVRVPGRAEHAGSS